MRSAGRRQGKQSWLGFSPNTTNHGWGQSSEWSCHCRLELSHLLGMEPAQSLHHHSLHLDN